MLKGNNLKYAIQMKGGKASGALNATTLDTPTIVEPWKYGRQVGIMWTAVIAAASVLTVKVLGRLRSDHNTMAVLNDSAGNPWQFDSTFVADGGYGDSGGPGGFGNIDLGRIDTNLYDGIAFRFGNTHADDVPFGAVQFIYDLYSLPGDTYEGLFTLQPSPVIANT